MTIGQDNLGGGPAAVAAERFAGHRGYRGRRDGGLAADLPGADHELARSRNGTTPLPDPSALPVADGSLADHPLLRGLLLELPPKGSTPPPGWLDRWFEAARSILELLYVQAR